MKYNHIDLEYIFDLADGDKEFAVEIISSFLENTAPQLESLSAAIQQNDEKEIAFVTHKLKGTFRFIGCKQAGDMLEQIEKEPIKPDEGYKELISAIKANYLQIEEELKDALKNLEDGI